MLRRFQAMVVGLGVLIGSGACATVGEGGASNAAEPGAPVTLLRVQNDNWQDMTVYVVRGTSRFRLGTVTGLTRETFEVPRTLLSDAPELQLMADPIGARHGEAYTTEPIPFAKGSTVVWTLTADLRLSHYGLH